MDEKQLMDMAADAAAQELAAKLKELNAEQLKGVLTIVSWIKAHYMKAGYKRLCKALLASV